MTTFVNDPLELVQMLQIFKTFNPPYSPIPANSFGKRWIVNTLPTQNMLLFQLWMFLVNVQQCMLCTYVCEFHFMNYNFLSLVLNIFKSGEQNCTWWEGINGFRISKLGIHNYIYQLNFEIFKITWAQNKFEIFAKYFRIWLNDLLIDNFNQ